MFAKREYDVYACMGELTVSLSDYLMLANPRAAPWTPWHRVCPEVNPSPFMAALEGPPDHVVVLVAERIVAATEYR